MEREPLELASVVGNEDSPEGSADEKDEADEDEGVGNLVDEGPLPLEGSLGLVVAGDGSRRRRDGIGGEERLGLVKGRHLG